MGPPHRRPAPEPTRVLVRHADAGARGHRHGIDDWRRLTPLGQAQAQELAVRLRGLAIIRVLSSPSLRCRQTVVPLAVALRLDVEPCRLLRAGTDPVELARFLADPDTADAVLCTDREVLLAVFAYLADPGTRPADGLTPMAMAAAWAVSGDGPAWRVRHLPALWQPDELAPLRASPFAPVGHGYRTP
jgi:8-oxo-dGTP diphosphatase